MKAKCPICTQTVDKVAFHREEYTYKKCKQCGTLFVADDIAPVEVHRHYDKGYYEARLSRLKTRKGYGSYRAASRSMLWTFQRRLMVIGETVKSGRLLDIGTAYGNFLQIAAERYDCVGMEISRFAANRAKHASGSAIVLASVEHPPFSRGEFDIITMWDVIEHLIDPVAGLHEVTHLLKPGGFCFISTDDASNWLVRFMGKHWWSIAPPLHLCHLSQEGVRLATQRVHQLHLFQITKDERAYELGEVVSHLGVAYQNKSLLNLSAFLKKLPVGRMHIKLRRPEQFIFILRKQA